MLISVITINRNNATGLKATMQSVFEQDFGDMEYLVIDGASTDGSAELVATYSDKITYWISEPDGGIYEAMNKGIAKASGKYLMFLNSGDTLTGKEVLSVAKTYIDKHHEADVFYGDAWFISKEPARRYLHKHPPVIDVSYFENYHLNHQAALIRADFFKEFGLYPSAYKWAGDHWMFLQAAVASKTFQHIDYLMVDYDDAGLSTENYSNYKAEANLLWNTLVPGYVGGLLTELKTLRRINGFKLVKVAHTISEKLHKLRRRRKA